MQPSRIGKNIWALLMSITKEPTDIGVKERKMTSRKVHEYIHLYGETFKLFKN
jgi:hypothetical protein